MSARRALGLALLMLAFTTLTALPAGAFVAVETADGTPVTWPEPCVGIWLHPRAIGAVTPTQARDALAASLSTWNAVGCSSLRFVTEGATCFRHVGLADWPGPQNIILEHDEPGSWPHAVRVVALTSVTFDPQTGEIVDADIELNGEDYSFAVDGSSAGYDLQQTLTHELGHVLGLDHTDIVSATMYATSYAGETSKRSLDQDDLDGVCAGYPAPIGGAPTRCQGPAEPAPIAAPWCPSPPSAAPDCAASGGPKGSGWLILAALGWLALNARRDEAGLS